MFDAKKVKDELAEWIRKWFEKNGPGCNAVIGISGGKDSSVVAALCVEALGKDRVFGVLMPNGEQRDIDKSYELVRHLGINHVVINIYEACRGVLGPVFNAMYQIDTDFCTSNQTRVNLPPRIRMATLYAVSQSINGRVSNNCNLSEDWVGYSTRWGDSVGDFSPLSYLTVTEVKAIGYELGLPRYLIEKVPSDGLCGKTDEDNLGFTYDVLDRYIRTGICEDPETKARIDQLNEKNRFKLEPMPAYKYCPPYDHYLYSDLI
jgi:NAD+ synthase